MEFLSPSDYAKETVLAVQEYSLLAWRAVTNIFRHPRYVADTLQQADVIGVGSVPIVVLTGLFTGAVLALAGDYGHELPHGLHVVFHERVRGGGCGMADSGGRRDAGGQAPPRLLESQLRRRNESCALLLNF